jgi:acetoin utilization deacetylase AcuC-like enzyme
VTTALISHPVFNRHEVPAGHPECPQRVTSILDALHANGLHDILGFFEAPAATREQLERVHRPEYIDALERRAPDSGFEVIDADTFMGPSTWMAAKHAAGAAILATDLVLGAKVENAFCCVRPPGHHATRDAAMGFCFLNNVAVAAAHAMQAHGLERVAILDFDVHHGNGTEDIFEEDGRVLLCSTFQHPFYPFTGSATESGHIVNVPLPPATAGAEFRRIVEASWVPAIDRFLPQMILVSAGFDAHAADPIGGLALGEADFAWISEQIVGLAEAHCGGRVVSTLEGGYDLDALGASVAAHIRALAHV